MPPKPRSLLTWNRSANRLTRRGVTVTTIKPGFVDTDILRSAPAKKTFWLITPEQAAEGIWRAIRARKQTAYIPPQWGLLMLIIRHTPLLPLPPVEFLTAQSSISNLQIL